MSKLQSELIDEIWMPIQDVVDKGYEVSNYGRIRSYNKSRSGRPKIIKSFKNNCGYELVVLRHNKKSKNFLVHRLVIITFSGYIDGRPEVNHINEIKDDNRLDNLEWVTRSQNMTYRDVQSRKAKSRSVKIDQLTLDGKLVKTWNSRKECHENGYRSNYITLCCKERLKAYKGYIWRYHEK